MYYKIGHNIVTEVSGSAYPQAMCLELWDAHSIRSREFANPENLELKFKLSRGSKVTDILTQAAISAIGLLVNQRVKDILEGFNLMQHRYYPVTINSKKTNTQYYWLHLVDNSLITFVDFPNSKFFRTKFAYWEEDITLKSYEDYLTKMGERDFMWDIGSESIKMNKHFDENIDLFVVEPFDRMPYFSKRLWDAFEAENITGLRIERPLLDE